MRESRVEAALKAAVEAEGGLAIKLASVNRRGLPDRLILLPGGRVDFIELKAPGKKPRILQARMHNRIRELGARVAVIDTLEKVAAWRAAL